MAYKEHMAASSSEELIRSVKRGVPYREFEELRAKLGVPTRTLTVVIEVSERTLARRKRKGRLQADESDRLYRIMRLYQQAAEVIGETEGVRRLDYAQAFSKRQDPVGVRRHRDRGSPDRAGPRPHGARSLCLRAWRRLQARWKEDALSGEGAGRRPPGAGTAGVTHGVPGRPAGACGAGDQGAYRGERYRNTLHSHTVRVPR